MVLVYLEMKVEIKRVDKKKHMARVICGGTWLQQEEEHMQMEHN